MDGRIKLAAEMAKEAGKILLSFQQKLHGYILKGPVDIVSEADKASEAYIIEQIRKVYPFDGLIAEETAKVEEGTSGYKWIIDPLDGTTNFVHGHPHFCVSIGLMHEGVPIGGVVYAPFYDELFTGQVDQGAFLNGRPIQVSTTKTLSRSLVASGFPYEREGVLPAILAKIQRLLLSAQGFRRAGSAALDLCYVACGRLDAYWEGTIHIWDVAAGIVILSQAGGKISGYDGMDYQPFGLANQRIVSSNGRIHQQLLDTLFPVDEDLK